MLREMALELKNSSLWTATMEEIDSWIRSELNHLKLCSKEELEIVQERIKAFEKVKNLPEIVADREE